MNSRWQTSMGLKTRCYLEERYDVRHPSSQGWQWHQTDGLYSNFAALLHRHITPPFKCWMVSIFHAWTWPFNGFHCFPCTGNACPRDAGGSHKLWSHGLIGWPAWWTASSQQLCVTTVWLGKRFISPTPWCQRIIKPANQLSYLGWVSWPILGD